MNDRMNHLLLLQVTVPTATVVTVAAEIRILEILGIISNPEMVKPMQLALALVPPETPATLKGLFQLLAGLIGLNRKFAKQHHDKLTKHLDTLDAVPDAVLTFGVFLPICETLLKGSHKNHGHKG